MFDFFKYLNGSKDASTTTVIGIFEEHNYKMKHDKKYKQEVEKCKAFFKANREAREKAGLTNKAGKYTFTCPNCFSICEGNWLCHCGEIHGNVGCDVCNIHYII